MKTLTIKQAMELLSTTRTFNLNIENKDMVLNSKGGIYASFPKTRFNSAIIYDESIKIFTLTKDELSKIIALKKSIIDTPLIDHDKFAFQRTHGVEAFKFCMECDRRKNISSKAIAIEI